jgi:hypothetical protein
VLGPKRTRRLVHQDAHAVAEKEIAPLVSREIRELQELARGDLAAVVRAEVEVFRKDQELRIQAAQEELAKRGAEIQAAAEELQVEREKLSVAGRRLGNAAADIASDRRDAAIETELDLLSHPTYGEIAELLRATKPDLFKTIVARGGTRAISLLEKFGKKQLAGSAQNGGGRRHSYFQKPEM